MNKITVDQAKALTKRYGGRAVGVIYKGPHKGTEWGTLLFVTESGFVFHSEDFVREFFVSWDEFERFHHISEPRSVKNARYKKSDTTGKFISPTTVQIID